MLAHGLTATRRYVTHGSRLLERSGLRRPQLRRARARRVEPGTRRARPTSTPTWWPTSRPSSTTRASTAPSWRAPRWARRRRWRSRSSIPSGCARWSRSRPRTSASRSGTRRSWRAGTPSRTGLERDGVDGFMRAYGVPTVEERFRGLVLKAIRQRIERHATREAVADALRVVPRSNAWSGGLEELEHLAVPTLIVASRDDSTPSTPLESPRPTRSGSRARSSWRGARRLPAGMARSTALAGDHGLPRDGPGVDGVSGAKARTMGIPPPCAIRHAEHVFCPEPFLAYEPMFWSSETTSEISGTPAAPRRGASGVERLREQLRDRLPVALDFATLGAYELTAPEDDPAPRPRRARDRARADPACRGPHDRPSGSSCSPRRRPGARRTTTRGSRCDPVAQTSRRERTSARRQAPRHALGRRATLHLALAGRPSPPGYLGVEAGPELAPGFEVARDRPAGRTILERIAAPGGSAARTPPGPRRVTASCPRAIIGSRPWAAPERPSERAAALARAASTAIPSRCETRRVDALSGRACPRPLRT